MRLDEKICSSLSLLFLYSTLIEKAKHMANKLKKKLKKISPFYHTIFTPMQGAGLKHGCQKTKKQKDAFRQYWKGQYLNIECTDCDNWHGMTYDQRRQKGHFPAWGRT